MATVTRQNWQRFDGNCRKFMCCFMKDFNDNASILFESGSVGEKLIARNWMEDHCQTVLLIQSIRHILFADDALMTQGIPNDEA